MCNKRPVSLIIPTDAVIKMSEDGESVNIANTATLFFSQHKERSCVCVRVLFVLLYPARKQANGLA